jgi:hypothetical protein
MPDVNLPLSGDVTQAISPWTAFFSAFGSQVGLMNINLGKSTDPTVEKAVIADVASYGKQLGRIEDALVVLLRHFRPEGKLLEEEDRAIRDLKRMLDDIADVKDKRSSSALRLCWPPPRGPDIDPSGGDQGTS